jgi:phosphoribosylaminoimidazole (AIR) synthetase
VAHITGGGIPGNVPRVLPRGRRAWIDRRAWIKPPIFKLIAKLGRVSKPEMDRTFNNGLGMILVVGKTHVDSIVSWLKETGEPAFVIGEIRNGSPGVSWIA